MVMINTMSKAKESPGGENHTAFATFSDADERSDYSLHVRVYRLRVIAGSLVLALALIGAMLPFAHDGYRVRSFISTDMDATEQKRMLDNYNSVSGVLTALLMKPLDVFVNMVVAVTTLCLATKVSFLQTQRGYFILALVGGVGYLMNTGFSSLNVQVVTGRIRPRVIAVDLAVETDYNDTQQLDADGLVTTTKSAAFRENAPGNSVLNTILRNLFVPIEKVPSWCNRSDDYTSSFRNTIANYGFPAQTWQQRALLKAVEPTEALTIPMNATSSDLPGDGDLPMNKSIATNLAAYAMLVSNSFLGWWNASDEVWNMYSPGYTSANRSIPLLMSEYLNLTKNSSSSDTLVGNIHGAIVGYFNKTENASTTDELATMEYSHIDLSDSVMFDALTIEIPTQRFGVQEDNSSDSNPFYRSLYNSLCNPESCLMPGAEEYTASGVQTTVYPRVQALAICLNDEGEEDLVVNFDYFRSSKRVQGDSFENTTDASASQVVNARMVYSLTVGRLSWTLDNIADAYNAECARDAGCTGIRFPLEGNAISSRSDVLVVGDSDIPLSLLSPINLNAIFFQIGSSKWKLLASTVEETRGGAMTTETRPAQIVLPRNFKKSDSALTANMKGEGFGDCEVIIDDYLNHIEKNHLYIEYTLQQAYTAGLYFIFQNGVVQNRILPGNETTAETLQFSGNIQDMYVQASIPTRNLILAIVGCILVAAFGVVVVIMSRGELLPHSSASTAVEAIANPNAFPPSLLQMQSLEKANGGAATVSLDSLRVEKVVLTDKLEGGQEIGITENDGIRSPASKTPGLLDTPAEC
ncbi:unnamed protein product [Phytophthora lilii]|uniref:Unnamed protein product n=1 Tax=Phytophthora lilii TaxID=2077276 RepID=A0A9W6TGI4_9STRA|nr:unnamed protein product [Phytophthora lilii]